VEPNCAIETVSAAPVFASSVIPGPSWPKISSAARGNVTSSIRAAPGTLSTATGVNPSRAAASSSAAVLSWWHNR